MTTIVINENTEEGRHLMGVIRAIRRTSDAVVSIFDEEERTTPDVQPIPGVPCTQEELVEAVLRSKEDIKAGRVVSHEDLKKQIATW